VSLSVRCTQLLLNAHLDVERCLPTVLVFKSCNFLSFFVVAATFVSGV
jgi:hypothetical protein